MKIFNALNKASIFFTVSVLAGCGAQQLAPSTSVGPNALTVHSAIAKHDGKPTKIWVFISDPGTSEVYIYDLPKLKLVEIVTGFTQPQGECNDNKGDVWVTDGSGKTIYKLEHSGKVLQTLSDTYGVPDGCAWDPKTGNLAVFNLLGTNSQSGAVLVYHKAYGTPNVYTNPKQYYYNFGGYDSSGNLFFDGRSVQNKFMLSELPVNANQAKSITVSGAKIYNPGMVEWQTTGHKQLVVGDQNCGNKTMSCVFRLRIVNGVALVEAETQLWNSSGGEICDLIQGALWGRRIVGSDFNFCTSGTSATYLWPYPPGGPPSDANAKNDTQPFGTAISSASGGN
jgi:hypothetical protein